MEDLTTYNLVLIRIVELAFFQRVEYSNTFKTDRLFDWSFIHFGLCPKIAIISWSLFVSLFAVRSITIVEL